MSENSALNRSLEMNQIEHLLVSSLIPYARNSRTHSDEQVSQIAGSIREFGFTNPVLIDADGTIIAGHGRVMAAKKLGLETVPCIRLGHLTPSQVRAYVIADNKLALNAGWDDQMLRSELESLQDDGFNMDLTGFSDEELAELLEPEVVEGETDPDEIPEPPVEPITKLGDIWVLGNHRLMCGDSTSIDAVQKMMNGFKADMVFTDPPYNINYSGTMSRTTKNGVQTSHVTACSKYDDIENDKMTKDKFNDFMSNILGNITTLCEGAWYISFGSQTLDQLLQPLRNAGMDWKSIIIWMKNQSTISGKDYKSRFEPIVYGRFNECFYGERYNEEDVWQIQRTLKNDLHPTMKPIALVEKAISNSSKTGNLVLDLFGGSGSTLIACEKTHRKARLMELDPKYCDVIVKRWEDFTGKKAVLEKA